MLTDWFWCTKKKFYSKILWHKENWFKEIKTKINSNQISTELLNLSIKYWNGDNWIIVFEINWFLPTKNEISCWYSTFSHLFFKTIDSVFRNHKKNCSNMLGNSPFQNLTKILYYLSWYIHSCKWIFRSEKPELVMKMRKTNLFTQSQ